MEFKIVRFLGKGLSKVSYREHDDFSDIICEYFDRKIIGFRIYQNGEMIDSHKSEMFGEM